MDRMDHIAGLIKEELENSNAHGQKRVWAELAEILADYDFVEHLECLEEAASPSDVVESCVSYVEAVTKRLKEGDLQDDLLAEYLGVEVPDE